MERREVRGYRIYQRKRRKNHSLEDSCLPGKISLLLGIDAEEKREIQVKTRRTQESKMEKRSEGREI